MAFEFARLMKDSGHCSLEKEFLMCSTSSFRKLVEQILRALRQKPMRMPLFVLMLWFE